MATLCVSFQTGFGDEGCAYTQKVILWMREYVSDCVDLIVPLTLSSRITCGLFSGTTAPFARCCPRMTESIIRTIPIDLLKMFRISIPSPASKNDLYVKPYLDSLGNCVSRWRGGKINAAS